MAPQVLEHRGIRPTEKGSHCGEAILAHGRAQSPEEQPYRYPDAVALARVRALREPSPAAHGLIGGLVTLSRYGRQPYVHMSQLSRMSR